MCIHAYVCTRVCTCTNVCGNVHIHMYVYVCLCVYGSMHTQKCVYAAHVCNYTPICNACVFMSVSMCKCAFVCIRVHMYMDACILACMSLCAVCVSALLCMCFPGAIRIVVVNTFFYT